VVASNTPRWLSGSLLRARTAGPLVTPATPEWSDHDGFTVARHAAYSWALVLGA